LPCSLPATSQQIPNAVNWALTHKRATYIEPGSASAALPRATLTAFFSADALHLLSLAPSENLWANVEIKALADLYLKLTQLLLSAEAPPPPHDPWTHYIFAATAKHHSWKELAIKVGDILKELGELEEGGAQGIDAKYISPAPDLVHDLEATVADPAHSLLQGVQWTGTRLRQAIRRPPGEQLARDRRAGQAARRLGGHGRRLRLPRRRRQGRRQGVEGVGLKAA
jgi:hypothetical protein